MVSKTHIFFTYLPFAGMFYIIDIFMHLQLNAQGRNHETSAEKSRQDDSPSRPCPVDPYQNTTWFDNWFDKYDEHALGIDRWTNYFYPYERHFGRWRGQELVMVEIGVQSGGSTVMWRDYFGRGLDYYGIDIDPQCRRFASQKVTILIGDQGSEEDLIKLMQGVPNPDIIIDDGGHTMKQQMTSFRVLFPLLKHGGVYLIEDLQTSYFPSYGGSSKLRNLRLNSSMIETSKSWIDILHLDHIKNQAAQNNPEWQRLFKTMGGIMFYNSMVFVEKTFVRKNKMIRKGGIWNICRHCDPGASKIPSDRQSIEMHH